jgi:riboflavin biosynthesis pyrimidine reductase
VQVSLKAAGAEIEFFVHDHGCGFSAEQIQRIDTYVQFERKMDDQEGLGLGLAIAKKLAELHGLADKVKICGKTEINFPAALRWLRKEFGVKRLLCEGGGEVNEAFFRKDLVDEIRLTICLKIFGGRNAPTIADGLGFKTLKQAERFQIHTIKQFEGELFTTLFRR